MNIEQNEQVINCMPCVCSGVSTFARTDVIDAIKTCMSLGRNVMMCGKRKKRLNANTRSHLRIPINQPYK